MRSSRQHQQITPRQHSWWTSLSPSSESRVVRIARARDASFCFGFKAPAPAVYATPALELCSSRQRQRCSLRQRQSEGVMSPAPGSVRRARGFISLDAQLCFRKPRLVAVPPSMNVKWLSESWQDILELFSRAWGGNIYWPLVWIWMRAFQRTQARNGYTHEERFEVVSVGHCSEQGAEKLPDIQGLWCTTSSSINSRTCRFLKKSAQETEQQ